MLFQVCAKFCLYLFGTDNIANIDHILFRGKAVPEIFRGYDEVCIPAADSTGIPMFDLMARCADLLQCLIDRHFQNQAGAHAKTANTNNLHISTTSFLSYITGK